MFGLSASTAVDHSKTTCPPIEADELVEKAFARADKDRFVKQKQCHELGLCRGLHSAAWNDIVAIHIRLQKAVN